MDKNKDEKKHIEVAKELFEKLKNRDEPIIHDAKIFYDKKQYTIRIPISMAKSLDIDATKDVFRLKYTPLDISKEDSEATLTGELIRG